MKLISSFLFLHNSKVLGVDNPSSCAELPVGEDGEYKVYPWTVDGKVDTSEGLYVYCEWDEEGNAATWLNLRKSQNYSKWSNRRLSDEKAHICAYSLPEVEPPVPEVAAEWKKWIQDPWEEHGYGITTYE